MGEGACFCGRAVSATRRKYCSYPCQALGARISYYRLDGPTYQQLLSSQSGLCAVCGRELRIWQEARPPSIDHNHLTGRVRGILCQGCNLRVGWFERAMRNGSKVLTQERDGFAAKIARYLGLAESDVGGFRGAGVPDAQEK